MGCLLRQQRLRTLDDVAMIKSIDSVAFCIDPVLQASEQRIQQYQHGLRAMTR
jgi:hypothetical protein